MAVYLFTDFGSSDIYSGQVRAIVEAHAPGMAVIDLVHEVPPYDIEAGAHLLDALARHLPPGGVIVAVVDPGVGSARAPVCLKADGRWLIGPDNGLLSVVAARASVAECYDVTWRPEQLSASFHGRDLFAPVAAWLATGAVGACRVESKKSLDVVLGAGDLLRVIYVDHYGNAITGIRAACISPGALVYSGERAVSRARVFADVREGEPFWYGNSLGLIEIAANRANASQLLGLRVGSAISIK